ncbi:TrkH family potassium uptake protein [Schlesneria paludicola]|uniref:TrkH family potassium uptake protein n=1 Tax=Schlesneria paludicola TaxID=360056 RepID=UPI00029AC550|nr:TrkH family potassium uptake protein [Schlesneria paludicola]
MIGQKQSVVRKWDFTVGRLPWWKRLTPPQLFVGSFALLVAFGTIGFKCLPGLYTGAPLTWEESLFTTTSAVCVTGLIVVDTATRFTPLGQAYVLLLIQLGGLGVIAFTSLVMVILGKRLSLRHESLASASASAATSLEPRQLVFDVVRFTIYIEAAGAALLYLIWVPRLGWRGAIWPAVFHSISAFCNAGFSTFSDSLIGYQESPATLIVISALIVAGGLGFLTLEELAPFVQPHWHKQKFRVSINSRLVLITTTILVFGGAAACAILEWNQTLKDLPTGDRLANALFMSVTARTAGFNSIDYAKASDSTNFLTILLMTIGGSPGSTAGGIKTTTFALLGLLAWSRMKGDDPIHIFGRSLPKDTIDRAVGLSVISFTTVTVGILFLAVTERGTETGGFLDRMFEAVSAFNTVGVSTGITANLSSAGKGIIITLMFVGRVGPLSAAAILARPAKTMARFRYAYEDVMVG